jgi:hypothetical protein
VPAKPLPEYSAFHGVNGAWRGFRGHRNGGRGASLPGSNLVGLSPTSLRPPGSARHQPPTAERPEVSLFDPPVTGPPGDPDGLNSFTRFGSAEIAAGIGARRQWVCPHAFYPAAPCWVSRSFLQGTLGMYTPGRQAGSGCPSYARAPAVSARPAACSGLSRVRRLAVYCDSPRTPARRSWDWRFEGRGVAENGKGGMIPSSSRRSGLSSRTQGAESEANPTGPAKRRTLTGAVFRF